MKRPREPPRFRQIGRKIALLLRVVRAWRRAIDEAVYKMYVPSGQYDRELSLARGLGVPLAEPSRWLRTWAFMWEDPASNQLFRVNLLQFRWPWRCEHCRQNNKSAAVCFFNKSSNQAKYEERLETLFELWGAPPTTYPEEFAARDVRTFPHYDLEVRTAISEKRVARQHMMPACAVLLLAHPFCTYLPVTVLLDVLARPLSGEVSLAAGRGAPANKFFYAEPPESHRERASAAEELRRAAERHGEFERPVRRRALALIERSKCEWKNSSCARGCVRYRCERCAKVKTFTLLHFCAQITGAVRDFLCSEFSARRGPFAGVPAVLAEGFAGEGVRVERPVLQAHIVGEKEFKKVRTTVLKM